MDFTNTINAPYSIGYWAFSLSEKKEYCYAFKKGEKIELDKEYFIKDSDGKRMFIFATEGSCNNFFLNLYTDEKHIKEVILKEKYLSKLRLLTTSMIIEVSFLISKSGELKINVYDYDEEIGKRTSSRSVILKGIEELLE